VLTPDLVFATNSFLRLCPIAKDAVGHFFVWQPAFRMSDPVLARRSSFCVIAVNDRLQTRPSDLTITVGTAVLNPCSAAGSGEEHGTDRPCNPTTSPL
jgi:hypothetical protein